MEHSNSRYETMTSLAKAALHLLRHLQSFTVNELLSQKRFHVVSGIFKLLDQSLLLVKNSLPSDETSSRVQSSKGIFQEAFESLNDSLGKRFRWNLLHTSDARRDEELQVTLCYCCHFWLTDLLTDGLTAHDLLSDCPTYSLIDRLPDRMTDWQTDGRTDLFTDRLHVADGLKDGRQMEGCPTDWLTGGRKGGVTIRQVYI